MWQTDHNRTMAQVKERETFIPTMEYALESLRGDFYVQTNKP